LSIDYAGQKETTTETLTQVSGTTAFVALVGAAEIEYETYAGMGAMVTVINSIGGSTDYYWMYYVNGEMPSVGADAYELVDGDSVEWKYTALDAAMADVE
jgi:hypothetical protein